jgi:hypothetical protein
MRIVSRAVRTALLAVAIPASAGAQVLQGMPEPVSPIGSVISADVVRDLPLGDSVYSLFENTQPEIISDRFNSGGLNVGGDARVGGFLGSWSQTLFRVGDVDVSDPSGSGVSLLFPDSALWNHVRIATGLMPADTNAPGLAVTLDPLRPDASWTRTITGLASGGSLAASAPAGQPPPVVRLKEFARGSGVVSGPLSPRVGLVAAGTWTRASVFQREQLATSSDSNMSGFAHLVFAPSAGREWRALGWVQRTGSPFQQWQPFQDPGSTTRGNAVHVQSTFEQRAPDAKQWRVFGGFTQRERTHGLSSTSALVERITDGPIPQVVDTAADTAARRFAAGARLSPRPRAAARHHPGIGVDVGQASLETSETFAGTVRETVDGIPARLWTYTAAPAISRRRVTTAAAHATDVLALGSHVTLDAALRAELVHGRAEGATTAITWLSLLPHAYLRLKVGERRTLVLGYSRSANALNQQWLAFGDPNGPVARVSAAAVPTVIVSRVGPGTEGDSSFSTIDPDLKRPYADELVIGWERRRSASTRYSLTGIARREANLMAVVDTGVPFSSYSTLSLPDAGKDLVDPADDRTLPIYNRLPGTFGLDAYRLSNPAQEAATAFALRMSWERSTERLFLLFGATASAAQGSGGSRGYGPLENDQDQPGEAFTNPNAATYARGRLFSDRAFTIKWTTLYRFPGDVTVSGIARYQDGQPFSRLVVAPNLNQGAEAVQAYPNGGSRYTFTGTLDVRVQKGFGAGRTRVAAILDAYNLFTRNNEVDEYVVSGSRFRTPTLIEPPPSVHLGLRLTF